MDHIITILAVVAFFIFQAYANYKKEQEKSAKRDPAQSRQENEDPKGPKEIPEWLQQFLEPKEEHVPERGRVPQENSTVAPERAISGSIDYKPVKYEQVKYVSAESPPDLLKEYRNLPDSREIQELKESIATNQGDKHRFKRLNPFPLDKEEAKVNIPEFNFRDAIIMKAILDRPYP